MRENPFRIGDFPGDGCQVDIEIPLGRFAEADEVARIACFLLSDDARYITGRVVQVDGGLAM